MNKETKLLDLGHKIRVNTRIFCVPYRSFEVKINSRAWFRVVLQREDGGTMWKLGGILF